MLISRTWGTTDEVDIKINPTLTIIAAHSLQRLEPGQDSQIFVLDMKM
jgi:hypothetical protein